MKLIINIPEEAYELLKSKSKLDNIAESIIANGTPYEERPQGEWITNKEYIDKEFNGHYEGSCFNSPYNCSCCGYSPEDNRPKFCPNCGARMVKGGGENDT